MTMITVVAPVYAVECDHPKCFRTFRSDRNSSYPAGLRQEAEEAGWSLRPYYGKGSRSAPDLCPDHKPATER